MCSVDDIRYVTTHQESGNRGSMRELYCKGLNLMSVKIFSELSQLRVQAKNKDKRILVDACVLSWL